MRVAVLDDYQDVALSMADWTSLGADVSIESFSEHISDPAELARRLRGFDVVVAMRERTGFDAHLLSLLPDLRLLVTTGMRNAAIDLAAAEATGVTVCGTRGLGPPTAELTWGLIHAVLRNIPAEDAAMRAGGWQHTIGVGLDGKTLGLFGLGRLGSLVARVGLAFGMNVVAWSENLTAERAAEHGVRALARDEVLATADVLSVHLVLSERTRRLIGAEELAAMKPEAILINTSRGPIVDEGALLAALSSGQIAGAGLDVYDVEPLPVDHPLRRAPRTVLTPHLGYVSKETYEVFYGDAVADIAAWRAGEPVRVLQP